MERFDKGSKEFVEVEEEKNVVETVPDKVLGKDDILGNNDIETKRVPVPEWGGVVLVRGLTASERDAFESSMLKGSGKNQKVDTNNIRAKLCSLSIVDEKGKRIFDSLDSINALGRKSVVALNRVYEVASKLSGLRDEDVEELIKNSGKDQLVV